jgi:hypothetical protein
MLKAVNVDERAGGWELSDPTFKVILFWPAGSWAVDTWDLSGCGVLDAIRWAQDHVRPDGAWAVGLIGERPNPDHGTSRGFTYLEGFDPNVERTDMSGWERAQVQVMLRRRATRVVRDELGHRAST